MRRPQSCRAMPVCPFYRLEQTFVERRKSRRSDATQTPPAHAPWCAHLYSTVGKYVATRIAGGALRLQCEGDLNRCQIPPRQRPKL
jgi:hypothetical protein